MSPANPLAERSSGVLLHPTSLPGRFGVGDLGPACDAWVDWLAAAGQGWWQVLPLGPAAWGNSPYGALSSFAGFPLMVSPEWLVEEGLLPPAELAAAPRLPGGRLDFSAAMASKERLLRASFAHFSNGAPAVARRAFEAYVEGDGTRGWLAGWSLYAALKQHHDGDPWTGWDPELRRREPAALAAGERQLADEIEYHRYAQFLFDRQWSRVRRRAAARGVRILGDLPIYVPLDSADVWLDPELFELDDELRPLAVAGVPPDAFSATGQLWGSPLYRWERLADTGYRWWIDRIGAALRRCDGLRIDHFRAFEAYWRVPAASETALGGRWVPGPGRAVFDALSATLGPLPLIAEDLGVITDAVRALRRAVGLPGMRVLQFAFEAPGSEHLPHHHPPDTAVYTGTHDNDTTRGWFQSAPQAERRRALDYLGCSGGAGSGEEIHWQMIRLAQTSVARLAFTPAQDLLGLGSEARMNHPGKVEGNWLWRLAEGLPGATEAARLRRLTEIADRLPRDERDDPPQREASP